MKFDPFSVDVPKLLAALGIQAEHDGDRWVARCPHPEHRDRNPSWDIVDTPGQPKHGIHHCLSCHFEGTATDLVAELLHISFSGARDYITERAMGDSAILQSVAKHVVPSGHVFAMPPEVTIAPLDKWPELPRRYVTGSKRRITAEQVSRWGLGYAVKGRLAGRIVIPARNSEGALLSYTARTFAGSPKRYLNPKKQEGPVPGAVFGEQHWPPPKERKIIVVTEGAFNALAAERVAELPLGSLFGSNVEVDHIAKLSTFEAALLLTDPDKAGDWAAERIERAIGRYVRLARVRLPEAEPGEKVDANSVDPAVLRAALVAAWRALR